MCQSFQGLRLRSVWLLTVTVGVAFLSMSFVNVGKVRCETISNASQSNSLSPNATSLSAVVLPMGGLKASSTNYAVNLTIGEAIVGNASSGDKHLTLGYQSIVASMVGACGDLDANRQIDITDIVYLINYLFAGGPAPKDTSGGDVDCDGILRISDAVYMVNYIFASGPVPCGACQ